MDDLDPSDVAWAQGVMAHWQEVAVKTADMLIKASRTNSGLALALLATQVHETHDQQFTLMLLGELTTRLVKAQAAVSEAHGPLATKEQLGIVDDGSPTPAWQVGVHDQIEATVEQGDYQMYAQLAVDGMIRATITDEVAPHSDDLFTYVLRALLILDQQQLALMATEAMKRLIEQARERG